MLDAACPSDALTDERVITFVQKEEFRSNRSDPPVRNSALSHEGATNFDEAAKVLTAVVVVPRDDGNVTFLAAQLHALLLFSGFGNAPGSAIWIKSPQSFHHSVCGPDMLNFMTPGLSCSRTMDSQ